MHVWHPVQVHSARDNRWAAAGVGALIMGLLLLTIALLESCTNPCHDYYRFDGRERRVRERERVLPPGAVRPLGHKLEQQLSA